MMVHGGAWTIPEHLVEASAKGTKNAVRAGYAVLEKGGSALEAIQAGIMVLEDDPAFDAGMRFKFTFLFYCDIFQPIQSHKLGKIAKYYFFIFSSVIAHRTICTQEC